MINCKHKPIKSQISISKDLYKFVFEDININSSINVIFFRYFKEDKIELIYVDLQYSIYHDVVNNQTLTLFDAEGEEDLKVVDFFGGITKMCKECFFEYLTKYKIEVLDNYRSR